jgi:hypothetical protein
MPDDVTEIVDCVGAPGCDWLAGPVSAVRESGACT